MPIKFIWSSPSTYFFGRKTFNLIPNLLSSPGRSTNSRWTRRGFPPAKAQLRRRRGESCNSKALVPRRSVSANLLTRSGSRRFRGTPSTRRGFPVSSSSRRRSRWSSIRYLLRSLMFPWTTSWRSCSASPDRRRLPDPETFLRRRGWPRSKRLARRRRKGCFAVETMMILWVCLKEWKWVSSTGYCRRRRQLCRRYRQKYSRRRPPRKRFRGCTNLARFGQWIASQQAHRAYFRPPSFLPFRHRMPLGSSTKFSLHLFCFIINFYFLLFWVILIIGIGRKAAKKLPEDLTFTDSFASVSLFHNYRGFISYY